jgi:hypothetical protein
MEHSIINLWNIRLRVIGYPSKLSLLTKNKTTYRNARGVKRTCITRRTAHTDWDAWNEANHVIPNNVHYLRHSQLHPFTVRNRIRPATGAAKVLWHTDTLLGNGRNTHATNNTRVVFSVVRARIIAMQRTLNAFSRARWRHTTTEEVMQTGVFGRSTPRLCFLYCVVRAAIIWENMGMGVQLSYR